MDIAIILPNKMKLSALLIPCMTFALSTANFCNEGEIGKTTVLSTKRKYWIAYMQTGVTNIKSAKISTTVKQTLNEIKNQLNGVKNDEQADMMQEKIDYVYNVDHDIFNKKQFKGHAMLRVGIFHLGKCNRFLNYGK